MQNFIVLTSVSFSIYSQFLNENTNSEAIYPITCLTDEV